MKTKTHDKLLNGLEFILFLSLVILISAIGTVILVVDFHNQDAMPISFIAFIKSLSIITIGFLGFIFYGGYSTWVKRKMNSNNSVVDLEVLVEGEQEDISELKKSPEMVFLDIKDKCYFTDNDKPKEQEK